MRPKRTTHGDYGHASRSKCPCGPCRAAVSKYAKKLRFDHERTGSRRVPVDRVREHLSGIAVTGVTIAQISNAAGVSHSVVRRVLTQPSCTYILPETHTRLMAVTLEQAQAINRVCSNLGAQRRVRALHALGHNKMAIAHELGVTEERLIYLLRDGQRVKSTTLATIHDVYLRMQCDVSGDSEVMRWKAYRNQWAPPWCWDEEDLDDPEADPIGLSCVVAVCTRPAHKASLCATHYKAVREKGGLQNPERYRLLVMRLAGLHQQDGERARNEIRDLQEVGLTSSASLARRLHMDRHYVEKLMREAS